MEQGQERGSRQGWRRMVRRRTMLALFGILLLVTGYRTLTGVLVANGRSGDIAEDASMAMPPAIGSATDMVNVAFQLTAIDTLREFATVEYSAAPVGRYGIYQKQSAYIRTPFSLQVAASGFGRTPDAKGSEIAYDADSYTGGFELPLNLYSCDSLGGSHNGDRGSRVYPDDRYCFDVMLQSFGAAHAEDGATAYDDPPLTWLLQYGSGLDGYRISYVRVPYFADTINDPSARSCYDWAVSAGQPCSVVVDAQQGYSRVIGMIERAPVVRFFTYVVLGMIVLAAICAVAVTLSVAARSRKPTLSGLSFLAGLLFAVQPLRAALPDAPPVGASLDVDIFYPSVLAIVSCLAVLAAIWVRRDDAA